jgi:hypothetical protein
MSNDSLCLAAENYMNGLKTRNLHFTKVIYDYKGKTEQQIKDSVQLEIDNVLLKNPAFKFLIRKVISTKQAALNCN